MFHLSRIVAPGTIPGLPPAAPGDVWALMDSGVEPHAAPHKRIFGNAKLRHNPDGGKYVAANGSSISSGGIFTINFKTAEGHDRHLDFQDADVAFPIISTGRLTDNNNFLIYHKKGGAIVDEATGQRSAFIRALGVYWIQLIVDPGVLTQPGDAGFGRQG